MTKQGYHHGDLANALLDAAETELSTFGIERFSLRAVAKRAGVSHAAPAHHFGHSRGLLTALAARGYERLLAAQTRREEQAGSDPQQQIMASALGYVAFAMERPDLFRLMFNSAVPDRSDARFFDVALSVFDRLVRHTRALNGHDPYDDQQSMLDLMASWAVVHGLAELIIAGRVERLLNLSALSDLERDEVLSSILGRVNTRPERVAFERSERG